MAKHNIVFIGLDTHKSFVEVAYIEDVRGVKPIYLGKNPSTKQSVKKLVRQFESEYPDATLHFVYEASLCGYWIYRLITSLGHYCYVIPSHYNVIVTAIAREVIAYIWAISREIVLTPVEPKLRLSRVPE